LSKSKKIGVKGNKKRREVLDFARDNNLVIHPGVGYDYYIDGFYMFGHCPCDKSRLTCPCPEAIEECKSIGHCKCRLLWRDLDTYKEMYVKGG